MATTSELRELLSLNPHPEGGFFSETFRDESVFLSKELLSDQYKVGRPVSTAIFFLLPSGSFSTLHRIPSSEVWHFYAGDPLTVLEIDPSSGNVKQTVLGNDLSSGHKLQHVVQPMVWFGAFPTKDFTIQGSNVVKSAPRDSEKHFSLVGCTVAPAFQFDDFEMAKREELVSAYPQARQAIQLLTRE